MTSADTITTADGRTISLSELRLILALADRCAGQSEALTKRAEK